MKPTKRREDETLLELVRSAMETMPDPVLVTDAEIHAPGPRIVYANPAFLELTGYSNDELMGRSPRMLQGPRTDRAVLDRLVACLEDGRAFHGQTYNYRKDGEPYLLEFHVSPMRDDDGKITHWVSIQRDVTEQVHLQREVLEAGARERRRIGHDLHDSLGQQLAGVAMLCKVLEGELAAKNLPEAEAASKIRRLISDAVEQTRTLAHGLAPIHAEPESLRESLHQLAEGTTRLFRIPCACLADEEVLVPDPGMADQLYHIAREAVFNAVKHADAGYIVIRLERDETQLTLTVEDDGQGIPDRRKGGMGLRTMTYRAESIGGGVSIQRREPHGTTVVCSVSIAE